MARGKSGRIVLEIDPELKRRLYLALEYTQQTMKEWFICEAKSLIQYQSQPTFFKREDKKNKGISASGDNNELQKK